MKDNIYFSESVDYGDWLKPDINLAAAAMKEVFQSHTKWSAAREQRSILMAERWSWDNSAKIATNRLNKIS